MIIQILAITNFLNISWKWLSLRLIVKTIMASRIQSIFLEPRKKRKPSKHTFTFTFKFILWSYVNQVYRTNKIKCQLSDHTNRVFLLFSKISIIKLKIWTYLWNKSCSKTKNETKRWMAQFICENIGNKMSVLTLIWAQIDHRTMMQIVDVNCETVNSSHTNVNTKTLKIATQIPTNIIVTMQR